ncbi:MAG: putative ABC transporter permease [Coriobacteriales bacterium]|jgi:uncharacterized membrane protein|nr:putative ABC transporter permease [Coriobacteriales bacterium]
MARDFSNPKKLGFMRFFQFIFALNIIATILVMSLVARSSDVADFSSILDFTNLIFDGISFWLIWKRKKITRTFIIGFSLFNLSAVTIYFLAMGWLTLPELLLRCWLDVLLLLYFLTSRRVKAVLTRPLAMEPGSTELQEDESYFRPRTWAFWRNLIIYFCVFSVVGHWMEAGYCTLIRFGILPGVYDPESLIWTEWFYPFLVYGFGMVACVLVFYPIKNVLQKKLNGFLALAISFVVNALVCTLIELVMGLILNQPLADGSLPLWDYRDMFCNFMGQVCLQNAIAFGLVATLVTWVVYPALQNLLGRIPKDIMTGIFIVVVILFSILFFLYCINILLPGFNEALSDTAAVALLPTLGVQEQLLGSIPAMVQSAVP